MKKRMKEFLTFLSLAVLLLSTTCYADVVDTYVVEKVVGTTLIVAGILVVLVVVIAI